MAGRVGLDGRDADGHVYGFLRGEGREDVTPEPPTPHPLLPEEEGGIIPAFPNDNDPED